MLHSQSRPFLIMARTVYRVRPPALQQPDASLGSSTPLAAGFDFHLEGVKVHALADQDSEMILTPRLYEDREEVGDNAARRFDDSGDPHRCW